MVEHVTKKHVYFLINYTPNQKCSTHPNNANVTQLIDAMTRYIAPGMKETVAEYILLQICDVTKPHNASIKAMLENTAPWDIIRNLIH